MLLFEVLNSRKEFFWSVGFTDVSPVLSIDCLEPFFNCHCYKLDNTDNQYVFNCENRLYQITILPF